MPVSIRYWSVLIFGTAALACGPGSQSSRQSSTTELRLEGYGGFAYVATRPQHMLEIAYLRSTNVTGCVVPQLGVELEVIEGNVTVQPASMQRRVFNLAGTVVRFPALEGSGATLNIVRPPRATSPFVPANPMDDAHWTDLRFVPSAVEETSRPLDPMWRDRVDGRLVLYGGTFRALHPSRPIFRTATWEFRRDATPQFRQAITDRTEYSTTVPADRVVLSLTNQPDGITQIEITPRNPGRPVRLKLTGKHTPHEGPLPQDHAVTDYCAFQELLQRTGTGPQAPYLIPHYIAPGGAAAGGGNQGGQPSPGIFCPGDISMF